MDHKGLVMIVVVDYYTYFACSQRANPFFRKENSKQTDAKLNERVTCNPFNFIYYCFPLSMSIKYALCFCFERHRRTHKINIKLGDLNIIFALLPISLYCSNFSSTFSPPPCIFLRIGAKMWQRNCKLPWVVKVDEIGADPNAPIRAHMQTKKKYRTNNCCHE